MPARAPVVALLALLVAPTLAYARSAPSAPVGPPVTFYVAKGVPDACGRGCDRWIAVEGQIDTGAAARFRKFLSQVKDRSLPIYFSSPGGNIDAALAMGAMLRERSATARVARTAVEECGFEAQDSEICLKLKRSGRELHGDLETRGAMCNSACPYLILGATTREIAPDAVLGVHSPRVVTHYSGGVPTSERRAADTERGLARAHGMLSQYLARMGGNPGLLALASTIRFEDMHALTREEIARFGIDRRELIETPWRFENAGRGMAYKIVMQKDDRDQSYRALQWRLICYSSDRFEFDFQRPRPLTAIVPTVVLSAVSAKPLYLTAISSKVATLDFWGVLLGKASVEALAAQPRFGIEETAQAPDGQRLTRTSNFSSDGLPGALEALRATCPPPKAVTVSSRDSTAK